MVARYDCQCISFVGNFIGGTQFRNKVNDTDMEGNNFLFANAIYLLPYTGAGSGIQRAMSEDNRLTFSNNEALHEFVITIARDVNTNSDTLSSDLDTKRLDLDTKQHFKLNNRLKDVVNYCTIPRSSKVVISLYRSTSNMMAPIRR